MSDPRVAERQRKIENARTEWRTLLKQSQEYSRLVVLERELRIRVRRDQAVVWAASPPDVRRERQLQEDLETLEAIPALCKERQTAMQMADDELARYEAEIARLDREIGDREPDEDPLPSQIALPGLDAA